MKKNVDLRSDYHACGDDGHGLYRPRRRHLGNDKSGKLLAGRRSTRYGGEETGDINLNKKYTSYSC